MIFLPFADFKRATKQNFIYKLSSDDKILPSLITKMYFSKSYEGNKLAITMCQVSIESTLLLFLLI